MEPVQRPHSPHQHRRIHECIAPRQTKYSWPAIMATFSASVCQRTDVGVLREHHLYRSKSISKESSMKNSQTPISGDLGGSTADRVASSAHETIDRVTAESNGGVDELRAAATKVGDSAKVLQEHAVQAARDKVREVRSYAESNPLTAAGIAFAAGVLLTALIRR
jgi:ElaB/YqjD/DUF883 family membrane-anchored ribosome-binding protein